jgi:hypothetical protein
MRVVGQRVLSWRPPNHLDSLPAHRLHSRCRVLPPACRAVHLRTLLHLVVRIRYRPRDAFLLRMRRHRHDCLARKVMILKCTTTHNVASNLTLNADHQLVQDRKLVDYIWSTSWHLHNNTGLVLVSIASHSK